jgi:hypothetical protein
VLERERLRREDCSWVALEELAQRLIEERQTPERPMILETLTPLAPVWADSIQMYHLMRLSLQMLQREGGGQAPLRVELLQREQSVPERNPFGRTVDSWIQLRFILTPQKAPSTTVAVAASPGLASGQSGFDLLMMRGIVRRHHGRMDLVNRPEEEMSLTLWLPVVQPEEEKSGNDSAR